MAASTGRAVLIEMGAESLECDLRTKTINFNGELVDVSTACDEGWVQTLADQFGTQNVTIALEGILKTDILSDMAFTGAQNVFTITVDDLFTLDGTWQFQSGFSIGAPYDDATTFTGTLQSSGPIVKATIV